MGDWTGVDRREVVISDEEKNAAINRMVLDLRAWRLRNPDAPLGWGERDPRLVAPDDDRVIA